MQPSFRRWGVALAVLVLLAVVAVVAVRQAWFTAPEQRVAQARRMLDERQAVAASLELKSVLQQHPQHAEARYLLARALLDSEQPLAAEAEVDRAAEAGHPVADVMPLKAEVMLALGKAVDVAQRFAERQVGVPARDAELRALVAEAHLRLDEIGLAETRAADALKADPANLRALVTRARVLAARGATDEAMALARQLTAKHPQAWSAWNLLGDLLQRRDGLSSDALQAYGQAAGLRPGLANAQGALILHALRQGDTRQAREHWKRLKAASPDNPLTLYHEALLASAEGKQAEANVLMLRLLRAQPDNFRFLLTAGDIASRLGAYVQAELHYAKASELQPDDKVPRRLLAEVQLRIGQYERAATTIRPLLAAATPEADDLLLAGQLQLLSGAAALSATAGGSAADAEGFLNKALAAEPGNLRVQASLAFARLSRGWHAPSHATLVEMARSASGAGLDLSLVNTLLRLDRLGEARAAVDALARKLPGSPLPDTLRARIALMQRDVAAAQAGFEAALQKQRRYFPAVQGLAAIDLAHGRLDAAANRFESLLESNPEHVPSLLATADILIARGQIQAAADRLQRAVAAAPADLSTRLKLIDLLLRQREIAQALVAAESAVSAIPDQPLLLARLGHVLYLAERFQQSAFIHSRWQQIAPRSLDARIGLARAQFAAGQETTAVDTALFAVDLSGAALGQIVDRLVPELLARKNTSAVKALARAMQIRLPRQGVGWVVEGDLAGLAGDADAALQAYRRAFDSPVGSAAAVRAHNLLLAKGRQAEAEALAGRWRKERPTDMDFERHLADLALLRGDLPQAEQRYRRVVAARPRDAQAQNNLAYTLVRQQRPDALVVAQRAAALAPSEPAILDTLAAALSQDGQPRQARDMQLRAVALAPESVAFRLNLARYRLDAQDADGARRDLDALAGLKTLSAEHRQAIEALRQRLR